jgi:dTDP-4-dehydrorhamnose 3,5-epimerase
MKFTSTPLSGAYIVEPERVADERGFFARSWCAEEFRSHGLSGSLTQCSISYNTKRGTLRGMHYQAQPHAEAKLVRCTAGAIYDVILDLRTGSPSNCKWFAVELTATNHTELYIPKGFAHGFQSLGDDSEVFYQISESYRSELSRGVRWNDPAFAIEWPIADPVLSERDRSLPDYTP